MLPSGRTRDPPPPTDRSRSRHAVAHPHQEGSGCDVAMHPHRITLPAAGPLSDAAAGSRRSAAGLVGGCRSNFHCQSCSSGSSGPSLAFPRKRAARQCRLHGSKGSPPPRASSPGSGRRHCRDRARRPARSLPPSPAHLHAAARCSHRFRPPSAAPAPAPPQGRAARPRPPSASAAPAVPPCRPRPPACSAFAAPAALSPIRWHVDNAAGGGEVRVAESMWQRRDANDDMRLSYPRKVPTCAPHGE